MQSIYEKSGASPAVLIRVREHIETDAVSDEYPIRHSWTFTIPPTPADQSAARKER